MTNYDPEQWHDQNFKVIIVENAWAAIAFAVPKCIQFFQHEPEIEPIREETLKIFLSDSFSRMDVPFLAKYENLAFTFLVEHEHDPYKFSIHRLGRYVNHLEEQYERIVIPIVYFPYAEATSKTVKREIKSSFMGKRYHYFTYEPVFLKGMPARKFLQSNNIMARLMLPFMRYSKEDWLEVLDSSLKGVLELADVTQGLRRKKYLDFLFQYFKLEKGKWEEYYNYKQNKKEISEADMISTLWRDEVRLEGKVEGKVEEGRDLLLMLLPKRLGPPPPDIENSIRALPDLERIHSILARFMEINDWREIKPLLNGAK